MPPPSASTANTFTASSPPSPSVAARRAWDSASSRAAFSWVLTTSSSARICASVAICSAVCRASASIRSTSIPGFAADGVQPAEQLEGMHLQVGASGLMLGRNRLGNPVVTRLFRPEQTRALVVGGVRCAQLVCLRAMALGARVVVQTARPRAWEPFVRGAASPGGSIAVVPPGRAIEVAPASALHPILLVVDIGPVGPDSRPGDGWQTTLIVRDEFSAADVDVASRADLLILQPLRPEEATLLGGALGLGEVAQWMTKIRPDMIAVVNRRAVRWAALAHTPLETHLLGPPGR